MLNAILYAANKFTIFYKLNSARIKTQKNNKYVKFSKKLH